LPRVVFVTYGTQEGSGFLFQSLVGAMTALGYAPRTTIEYESFWANGKAELVPG
jgi:hypothetical protein